MPDLTAPSHTPAPAASVTPAEWEPAFKAYLAAPPYWLRFPAPIENHFLNRSHDARLKRFHFALRWSIYLFAVLAVCDWFLLPDIRIEALGLRAAAVALMLFCYFLLPLPRMVPHRESIAAGVIAAISVAQAAISVLGGSQSAIIYDEALILSLLLCNQLGRIRFRQAVPFTLFWIALYIVTLLLHDQPNPLPLVFKCVFITLLALISLHTKRAMELDNRNTFALKGLNSIATEKLALLNVELSTQARFDTLTSLPNRRHFEEHMERMLRNAARNQEHLSLLYVDIDYFKAYNDRYGHQGGDDCLCVVASVLRFTTARPLDLAARHGGEEFVIVLPDTRLANAIAFALEMCQNLRELKIPHESSPIQRVSVSVGVTGKLITPTTTLEELLAEADAALYKAKGAGRDQVYPPA